ncbi:hypothetical protein V1505DRAFT_359080 [Lipomyces doorenjongii]
MRLIAMIPHVFIMILGNVINAAVRYQRSWPCQAIVLIGYPYAGTQVTDIPGIASTSIVDSYKPVTGPIFIAITINKNLWGIISLEVKGYLEQGNTTPDCATSSASNFTLTPGTSSATTSAAPLLPDRTAMINGGWNV